MAKPTKPGEQAEMAKVFYFFAIESLHIRRNESETAKRVIYLACGLISHFWLLKNLT